jgi:hypothetical membrane protein
MIPKSSIAQIVVQSAWVTPFSLTQNFISDLGNTACGPYPPDSGMYVCSPWHTWMNASFILLGLIILVGAALVRKAFPPGRFRAAGLMLLALAGAGNLAVGFFPEDVNITYHRLGAAAHFILGNLGMVALGIALVRRRPALAVYSIVSGLLGLLATTLFHLRALLEHGHWRNGATGRISVALMVDCGWHFSGMQRSSTAADTEGAFESMASGPLR